MKFSSPNCCWTGLDSFSQNQTIIVRIKAAAEAVHAVFTENLFMDHKLLPMFTELEQEGEKVRDRD